MQNTVPFECCSSYLCPCIASNNHLMTENGLCCMKGNKRMTAHPFVLFVGDFFFFCPYHMQLIYIYIYHDLAF